MKKLLLFLLFKIITITNSYAMLTKLPHLNKTANQANRLNFTQTNDQNKTKSCSIKTIKIFDDIPHWTSQAKTINHINCMHDSYSSLTYISEYHKYLSQCHSATSLKIEVTPNIQQFKK